MIHRRTYTPLWWVLAGDRTPTEVARELGITVSVAHGWATGPCLPDAHKLSEAALRRLARIADLPDVGLTTAEAARIGRLVIAIKRAGEPEGGAR